MKCKQYDVRTKGIFYFAGISLRLLFLTAGILLLLSAINVKAEEITEIYTPEDLCGVADNPSGSYILMNDIDMTDVVWKPVDFTGSFDGNNHAILNLSFSETSSAIRTTYDGNYKMYDTHFAGLFGTLEDASVRNLSLLGIKAEVFKEEPCFIGSVAGFAERSTIENCTIEGTLRLDVSTSMFGVGGIVGYGGNGSIKETDADVTLICIDHDKENRDEQFMGGAYSAGYLDADGCNIIIDGYDSDHGYVHDGGLVGMYILYPRGTEYAGTINNNRVEGMITFFEDNTDRMAYCKDFIGEVMNWTYEYVGNSSDFVRNEIMDYSKDLLPHNCEGSTFMTEEADNGSEDYGYTLYTCENCKEYSYKSDYKPKEHYITQWTVVKESTYEEEGMEEGICAECGEKVYRMVPVIEEEPSEVISETVSTTWEESESEPVSADAQDEKTETNRGMKAVYLLIPCGILLLVSAVAAVILIIRKKQK